MRRILVPLDGSEMAASILPDAARFARAEGEPVLMRDTSAPTSDYALDDYDSRVALANVQEYLEQQADRLRAGGARVRVQTFAMGDVSLAIDETARIFHVDMIACATHGRRPFERLMRGGVAWKALAHSQVPILLRHPHQNKEPAPVEPRQRHIMVPLDGSPLAE